jgi:iron complex transport system ATP-binding protein
MLLRADDLTVHLRPGVPVLQEVSALFMPHELTAVLGPNGAGKSTLLRALSNTHEPHARAWDVSSSRRTSHPPITLAGLPIHAIPPETLATRLAYLPQREDIAVGFTVREIVALGTSAGGPADHAAATDHALHRLDLLPLQSRTVETLSEGQRQRVALARAFAQTRGHLDHPGVVLADEPASALDPAVADTALTVFRELAAKGRTVVVVMHDPDLALRFATHALLLSSEGRIAAQGPVRDTLTPDHLATIFGGRWTRVTTPTGRPAVVPA